MIIYYFLAATLMALMLFYLKIKHKKTIIFTMPIVMVVMEILRVFAREFGYDYGFNGFTFIVILSCITLSSLHFKKLTYISGIVCLFVLMVGFYLFRTSFPMTPDYLISTDNYLNVLSRLGNFVIVISLFFIGFINFKNRQDLLLFHKSVIVSTFIYCIAVICFSIAQFGEPIYRGGFIYGFSDDQVYFTVVLIVSSPFIIFCKRLFSKNAKNMNYFSNSFLHLTITLSVIVTMLTMRRTVILIIIAGLLFYIFSEKNIKSIWSKFVPITLIVISAFFIYTTGLYLTRERVFDPQYSIADEGRVIEFQLTHTLLVYNNQILFGTGELFDEYGKYGQYGSPRYLTRSMHGTFSRVLFGSGYMGIFLLLIFFASIYIKAIKYKLPKYKDNNLINSYFRQTKVIIVIFIYIYLISLAAGMPNIGAGIGYSSTVMLYLGILLSWQRYLLSYSKH